MISLIIEQSYCIVRPSGIVIELLDKLFFTMVYIMMNVSFVDQNKLLSKLVVGRETLRSLW
ncbi:protein of unknown function [Legionella fallonii LLAP-10]|uniref:Uncharacterized protein n=1 Tax=Legionella fallonii LLAP-10 TaxID=1212491 RepID=A0A098G9J5_9GAMM|nr:protein of unknown function [Legionella fallonii LLAP-10]